MTLMTSMGRKFQTDLGTILIHETKPTFCIYEWSNIHEITQVNINH